MFTTLSFCFRTVSSSAEAKARSAVSWTTARWWCRARAAAPAAKGAGTTARSTPPTLSGGRRGKCFAAKQEWSQSRGRSATRPATGRSTRGTRTTTALFVMVSLLLLACLWCQIISESVVTSISVIASSTSDCVLILVLLSRRKNRK